MAKKRAAKKASKTGAKRTAKSRKTSASKTSGAKAAKKSAKRGSQKRETLKRGNTNVAYAKRRTDGTFKEDDAVGRSLSRDRRQKAKAKVKPGYGDQGDEG